MTNSLASIRFVNHNVKRNVPLLKIHQFAMERFHHKFRNVSEAKKTEVQEHERKFDFYSTQETHQMVLRQ